MNTSVWILFNPGVIQEDEEEGADEDKEEIYTEVK